MGYWKVILEPFATLKAGLQDILLALQALDSTSAMLKRPKEAQKRAYGLDDFPSPLPLVGTWTLSLVLTIEVRTSLLTYLPDIEPTNAKLYKRDRNVYNAFPFNFSLFCARFLASTYHFRMEKASKPGRLKRRAALQLGQLLGGATRSTRHGRPGELGTSSRVGRQEVVEA